MHFYHVIMLSYYRVLETNLYLRSEFEKSIKVDKRDFAVIEFLLRKGHRQLEMYSAPGIKDIR